MKIRVNNTVSAIKLKKNEWLTQMSADAETVDLMMLIIQAQDGLFVNIVGGNDGELGEPRQVESLGDLAESVSCPVGKIGKVAWI